MEEQITKPKCFDGIKAPQLITYVTIIHFGSLPLINTKIYEKKKTTIELDSKQFV